MADRVDNVHDLLKEMVDFFRDNFNSSADFLNASSARYFDGLLKTADAALALPAPMADRVDLRQNIETILVNRRAWAKTLRARRFETEPREIEAFADELAAALALPAEPPQANEYPKPCGLCPGTIESRTRTRSGMA